MRMNALIEPGKRKQLIIMAGLLITLVIAASIVYQSLVFRVTKVTPTQTGTIPSSTSLIEVHFNKPLDSSQKYMEKLTDPQKIVSSIEISDKTLRIAVKRLEDGDSYRFAVKDIIARNQKNIDEVAFAFTAEYVPYQKLSQKEKDLQLSTTDRGNHEDPIEKHLPYSELSFSLKSGYEPKADGSDQQFVVIAELILSATDVRSGRDQAIAAYKKQVEDFIRSKGLDPTAYKITYNITEYSPY